MSDLDRPRPTIADVARAAGVSPTTVSHALRGLGKVNPETRNHVRLVAEQVGYRASPRARALRGGRSYVLGVVSSMTQSVAGGPARLGFFMEVAAAAAERALAHGYALVLVPPTGGELPTTLDTIAVDGLLVVEPADDDPMVALAREQRIPFVSLGTMPATQDEPFVDLDATVVADLLVSHLADQGVQHPVLMVGDRPRPSYREVVSRFRQEAQSRGWAGTVVTVPEADGVDGADAATRALLEEEPRTDGIIAFVDAFATGVVSALADLGRKIPGDVVVMTRYDGVRARTSVPLLTAVDLQLGAAAARAVDLLIAEVGDGDADLPPLPPLPTRVSPRWWRGRPQCVVARTSAPEAIAKPRTPTRRPLPPTRWCTSELSPIPTRTAGSSQPLAASPGPPSRPVTASPTREAISPTRKHSATVARSSGAGRCW